MEVERKRKIEIIVDFCQFTISNLVFLAAVQRNVIELHI